MRVYRILILDFEQNIIYYNVKGVITMEYTVNLIWDDEAQVSTSEDIPGLVLESGSFDVLLKRIRFAVPELLKLNTIFNF